MDDSTMLSNVDGLTQLFNKLDLDHDGRLNSSEMTTALSQINQIYDSIHGLSSSSFEGAVPKQKNKDSKATYYTLYKGKTVMNLI